MIVLWITNISMQPSHWTVASFWTILGVYFLNFYQYQWSSVIPGFIDWLTCASMCDSLHTYSITPLTNWKSPRLLICQIIVWLLACLKLKWEKAGLIVKIRMMSHICVISWHSCDWWQVTYHGQNKRHFQSRVRYNTCRVATNCQNL